MKIQIFSEADSPRLRYVLELVFSRILECPFQLYHDKTAYLGAAPPHLNYSHSRLSSSEIFLPAGRLLFEKGIRLLLPQMHLRDGLPALFPTESREGDLDFDLFAMIFYLAGRYEEYLPFEADPHGRFPAAQSLAFKRGFLHRPLIDEWALRLGALIHQKYPRWRFSPRTFVFQPTYDVDLAWAFRHRPVWTQVGGMAGDIFRGRWPIARARLRTWNRKEEDPFFTFPYLDRLHRSGKPAPLFFFLLTESHHPLDRSLSPRRPAFRRLIRRTADRYEVGIHPSYLSNERHGYLPEEIARLQAITGRPVRRSRQHFLRLRLPDTYRRLLATGITADYTMGYADAIGFRASLATPYPWYDLKKEQPTELVIYPFQIMDVTLKHYLDCSSAEALPRILPILEATRRVAGTFCTLWHNSSFSAPHGWNEWQRTYERLLAAIS